MRQTMPPPLVLQRLRAGWNVLLVFTHIVYSVLDIKTGDK